jgi:multiple sugar transport system substrate-binding protein/sn-glycerol 3-phosphate transport system substrate-binding protein
MKTNLAQSVSILILMLLLVNPVQARPGSSPVEVRYWTNRPQKDVDMLQSMLDEFNASHPEIHATAQSAAASYPELANQFQLAFTSGNPPELVTAYANVAGTFYLKGMMVDLNPYINHPVYGLSDADRADYFPAFLASDISPQLRNVRLGFPTQRSMEVMYYNADWLAALGYNAPPTDWATFKQIACQASQTAGKYGWAFRHDASNFASQIFSRGGNLLAEDASAYVFNNQAGIDTTAFIQALFKDHCAVEIPTSERYGEMNRFGNGTVLFVFASSAGMPFYANAVTSGAKFKWSIAPLPSSGTPFVNIYGASIAMARTTPEKQLAAWQVLKFMGEKSQTARWSIQTGYLPVRMSAKADVIAGLSVAPGWEGVADMYGKMFDWVQYGKNEPNILGYDPVRALIDTDVMSVVISNPSADVPAVLNSAVNKANLILKQYAPHFLFVPMIR